MNEKLRMSHACVMHEMSRVPPNRCASTRYRSEKNGFGTYSYANGDRYVGTFRADLIDGEGLYTFKNRDSYNGQVSQCLRGTIVSTR
jgi:hypothetical protein